MIDFAPCANAFEGGRGFIYNPDIAPDPMGVAVFHQLHCLVRFLSCYLL